FTGDGNDKIFITGSGNKFLMGGEGEDKFIFYPGFKTNGNFGTVIVDFEIYNFNERIDLSRLTSVKGFEDLKISQISSTMKDFDIPLALKPLLRNSNEIITLSVIEFAENQRISLLNIETKDLSHDNFLFKQEATAQYHNALQIEVENSKVERLEV
ncbi:MAG TPA: hypothetical protein ACFYEJ_12475, partial [Candidatus Wujingus californicus]